jgi:antitoxin ParD1/3/4
MNNVIIYNWYYSETEAMQKNTSVTLGEHFEAFIASQIDSSRFTNASEVIQAGLRLLEERELQLAALRLALIEGENSGITEYSMPELLSELDEK